MSGNPAALRDTIVAVSDSKLLLGYHYGEWTFGPPAIEAGIAACSMAQEEFGHARLLNGILKREFELEIDPLNDTRPSAAFASIAFLDEPLPSWTDLVAANAVVDQALTLELSAFREGGYDPLSRMVPKLLMEERFHLEHAEGWVRLIDSRGDPDRGALRASLSRALHDVVVFFGPPGHDKALIEEGMKTATDEDLRNRLLARMAELVSGGTDDWPDADDIDWSGWDPVRRRADSAGPQEEMLDELRGTRNIAFKTA